MPSPGDGHVFSGRAFHKEGQWNEQCDDDAQNEECADEGKHVRLRVDDLL